MSEFDQNRFEEIMYEIKDLVDEAFDLLPEGFPQERAKGYWYAQIQTAINNDHEFMSSSMVTMADSVEDGNDCEEE